MSIQNVYQDAVISGGNKRKYTLENTGANSVYINDVTTYSVTGSEFGATDANQLAEGQVRINTSATSGDDKNLYDALTAIGWTDAVDGVLLSKNLFAKLVNNASDEYTSNNWTVRKNANGTFEAWRKYTASGVAISTQVGSVYQTASNLTLQTPSGVGTIEYANVTPIFGTWSVWAAMYGATTTQLSYRLMSTASRSSTSYTLGFYIKGTM